MAKKVKHGLRWQVEEMEHIRRAIEGHGLRDETSVLAYPYNRWLEKLDIEISKANAWLRNTMPGGETWHKLTSSRPRS